MELHEALRQAGVVRELSAAERQYSKARAQAAPFDSKRGRAYLKLLLQSAGAVLSSVQSENVSIRAQGLTLNRAELPTVALRGSFSIFDGRLELGLPEPLSWLYENFDRLKQAPEAAAYLSGLNVRTSPISSSASTTSRPDLIFYLGMTVELSGRTYEAYVGFDSVLLSRMNHYRIRMENAGADKQRLRQTKIQADIQALLPLYSLSSVAAIRPGGRIPLMKNPNSRWLLEVPLRPNLTRKFHCRITQHLSRDLLCFEVERITNHQNEEDA